MYLIVAAVLGGLALLAAIVVAIWLYLTIRLNRHAGVIADAEQLKSVDLSAVITAHVPLDQRTNDPDEEIALAKREIARKQRSTRTTLIASACMLVLLLGANGVLHVWFAPARARLTRQTSVGVAPAPVDPMLALPGTWGWKFNALLSCKENPHTITLSSDRKRVSIRFKTPLPSRNNGPPIDGYDYTVVRSEPSELVLRLDDAAERKDAMGRPLEWSIHFEDKNTYFLKRSDVATQDTGSIVRCN